MKRDLKKREWADKVDKWLQSGKSAKAWCRENQEVYSTFLGWHYRLQSDTPSLDVPSNISKSQFIELKEEPQASSGISLEYQAVIIHLATEFNASALKKCLHILGGGLC